MFMPYTTSNQLADAGNDAVLHPKPFAEEYAIVAVPVATATQ
jgi:hypothetical protein